MEGVSTDVDAIVTELARTGEVGWWGRNREKGAAQARWIVDGWVDGVGTEGRETKERGQERREDDKGWILFPCRSLFFCSIGQGRLFAEQTKEVGQDGKDEWAERMQKKKRTRNGTLFDLGPNCRHEFCTPRQYMTLVRCEERNMGNPP